MSKPFIYIYQYFAANRKIFYLVFGLVFLVTGYYSLKIKPEEDISRILPKDRQSEKLGEIFQNGRFVDRLVLIISEKDSSKRDPESITLFADSFSVRLKREYPGLVSAVENRVNDSLVPRLLGIMTEHLPVFMEPDDYRFIDSLRDPALVTGILKKDIQTLSSPAGFVMKPFITGDPLGIGSPVLRKIRQIQYDDNFDLYDGHIITKDERYSLIFIRPVFSSDNTGKNKLLLEGMDQVTTALQQEGFSGIDARYFGGAAVAVGNAVQLRKDTILTLGLTSVFLVLFISFYFKRKRAPILILVPVVQGVLFSLSIIYWIKGTISVIALAAGCVVMGIAINYSLHVYNHFRHRRDMRDVLEDLSFPLTIGSLTTIGGFLCLQFVKSDILKDLGLFAALSLIGASLSSLIFLPQMIGVRTGERSPGRLPGRDSWINRFSELKPEKNKWLIGMIFAITIFLGFFVNRVQFDQDILHMNYMPENLKSAENILDNINAYSLRSVYLVTEGKNLEEVLRKQEAVNTKINDLKQSGIVRKQSGVFQIIISDSLQDERIRFWNRYWTADRKAVILKNLDEAGMRLGFSKSAFEPFRQSLDRSYFPLNAETENFLRSAIASDYIIEKKDKVSLVNLLRVEVKDKSKVYGAFQNDPDLVVIDRQFMTSRLLGLVTADFNQIGWMVSILVFAVLLLTYGRIELALVSFIPMLIAFIWILGIMGLAGMQFNIVNIILSALIFGLGDDYSLFIMDGLLQEYKTGKKNLSSYKSSIILSAITTLAGLGVLVFAKHPALRSIAFISITGILSVVFIAQVLIPFFFRFLITNRIQKGRFPWTGAGLIKSVFSLSYFAVGSWLVTILGFFLIKWNPWAGSRARWIYHKVLSSYTWSVLYIMGNVKKKIVNPQGEDFSKPCVMIANHQSFLDILVMTMLYPKVILLTNEWVWNSPVFGKLVRIAGYYPVANGIENSIPYLREQVAAGYSIAIFPEGTRSADDTIRRFHKGAFFIAEKLDLDILPIMIHGTGYTMSKNDFLLKDGYITIEYLPRIKPGDDRFGNDYTENAKSVGRYFRQEYSGLKSECEQPFYFREQLVYNYIYKGPVLEWYLRVKIRLEKSYRQIHQLLPKEGRILDIGCGYGFMSYMMQFCAAARQVTGYDYDEDKIKVASHCFSRNAMIQFKHADVNELEIEPADAIILSDLLHYLHPDQQESIIKKCIQALRPDGILLIRDGDRDLENKHKKTRLSEFFSTRLFAFNKTKGQPLHFMSGKSIHDLARRHHMDCRALDQSAVTSNLLFVISHPVKAYEKV